MVKRFCVLVLVLFACAHIGITQHCPQADKDFHFVEPTEDDGRARYDNYRVYHIQIENEKQTKMLDDLDKSSDSFVFYGRISYPKNLSVIVAAHRVADFSDLMRNYDIHYRILSYNLQEKIDREKKNVMPSGTAPEMFDWNHYFPLETIYGWIEKQASVHNFVELVEIGQSYEGIVTKGLKIAKNPLNPSIFIEAGIHAREWIAPSTACFLVNELLTSQEAGVKALTENYNWYILPIVNPDGYKYTFERDRMWRKNRRLFNICYGVDLNRNFPYMWNGTGAYGDPCDMFFAGPSHSSEVETQNIINFLKQNAVSTKIRVYISLHSFSQLIMFPYGATPEKVKNYDDLLQIGKAASQSILNLTGRKYVSGSTYETIYPASGSSVDWAYAEVGIPVAYTIELRGPPDTRDMFILPAEEITPTGQEAFAAIRSIVEGAKDLGYFD